MIVDIGFIIYMCAVIIIATPIIFLFIDKIRPYYAVKICSLFWVKKGKNKEWSISMPLSISVFSKMLKMNKCSRKRFFFHQLQELFNNLEGEKIYEATTHKVIINKINKAAEKGEIEILVNKPAFEIRIKNKSYNFIKIPLVFEKITMLNIRGMFEFHQMYKVKFKVIKKQKEVMVF